MRTVRASAHVARCVRRRLIGRDALSPFLLSCVRLLMADEWMKYAQMNHPQIKILSEFQKQQTLATNQLHGQPAET